MTDTPTPRVFLSASWRTLAMLNYRLDPAILLPYLPNGTELDTWNNTHCISIVGFLFLDTKVLGVPIPFHRNFEEVNLRFYVRRRGPEGWRRGVVFIKEIVPRRAIAAVARGVYNENYVAMPMRHRIEERIVEYEWRPGAEWNGLRVERSGEAMPLIAGSEEEFITEHYWGYAAQRDGSSVEYRVEHPSWRVWRADRAELRCDAEKLYGRTFAEPLMREPLSAFVAEGSEVKVYRGARVAAVEM